MRYLNSWASGAVALALATVPTLASAEVFSEDFESFAALSGSGWVFTNASASPSQPWFAGNPGVFAAASGSAGSYIAASFLSTSLTEGTISNWAITPLIGITGGEILSFAFRTDAFPGFADSLVVKLSATGSSATGSFDSVLLSIPQAPTAWATYTVTLPQIASGVRIGFEYSLANALDANYIGIDSVSVTPIPEPTSALLLAAGLAGLMLRRRLAVCA